VARGLEERSLISSTYPESLDLVGELAPGVRRGWSVPRARRDYTQSAYKLAVLPLVAWMRARLPRAAARMIRSGRCEAVMCHWRLISPALVRAVHGAGGQLYVWTVDDAARIGQLSALGVDGVITNDPRLFD
jgi:glycerophosphoryl diester phosphodiesterase